MTNIYIFSLKVLFTFDSKFVTTFGAAAMDKIIALVKNAYKDKTLKKLLGTTVQVTGNKKKYTGVFKDGRGASSL